MQLLSKVVKSNFVNTSGEAVISTKVIAKTEKKDADLNTNYLDEDNVERIIQTSSERNSFHLSSNMIEEANKEALKIKNKAYQEAVEIEKKAYDEGYSKGSQEGYSAGYLEGQRAAMEEIHSKERELLEQAYNILQESKDFKHSYLNECEREIKEVVSGSIVTILRKSIMLDDVMDGILKEHLSYLKKEEEVTLYVNSHYFDYLSSNNKQWLEDMNSQTDMKVVVDESVAMGAMVIEKSDGKINVDILSMEEEIKEAVYSE